MSRQWQIFEAPGSVEQLPLPKSPWHDGALVQIPKEHWDIIVKFAEDINLPLAEQLKHLSFQFDPSDDYGHHIISASASEMYSTLNFIENLKFEFLNKFQPQMEPDDEVPEPFEVDEYIRILDAVEAVLKESIFRKKPYRAWIE